jgi:hypothetical protein
MRILPEPSAVRFTGPTGVPPSLYVTVYDAPAFRPVSVKLPSLNPQPEGFTTLITVKLGFG